MAQIRQTQTSEVALLLDRAIDHDQAIILTAELLKHSLNSDEHSLDLLNQIIKTALKNSTLITQLGKETLDKGYGI